jgi:hypothetical protein
MFASQKNWCWDIKYISVPYLVDLASGYIVVPGEFNIKKPFIIPNIQVHLQDSETTLNKVTNIP